MNINQIHANAAYLQALSGHDRAQDSEFGKTLAEAVGEKRLAPEFCSEFDDPDEAGISLEELEKKVKENFWRRRSETTEQFLEQRGKMYVKRYQAQLRMIRRQMFYGEKYRDLVPTLSAAQLLFGADMLMDSGEE